ARPRRVRRLPQVAAARAAGRPALIALLLLLGAADAGARELASGSGSVTWSAPGPVRFAVRSYAADIEVIPSPSGVVTVTAPGRVRLLAGGGDRGEVDFGGKRQLHDGK